MKSAGPQPPPVPLTRAKARNAVLMNLLATPGLGSLMARRRMAGTGQLVVFLAGFLLFMSWFARLMIETYREVVNGAAPHSVALLGELGVGFVAVAWIWSLFTSLSILREGKANEAATPSQS